MKKSVLVFLLFIFRPLCPLFGGSDFDTIYTEPPTSNHDEIKLVLGGIVVAASIALVWKLLSNKDNQQNLNYRDVQIIPQPRENQQETVQIMSSLGNMGNAVNILLETKLNNFLNTINDSLTHLTKKIKKDNSKNKELLKKVDIQLNVIKQQVVNLELRLQHVASHPPMEKMSQ